MALEACDNNNNNICLFPPFVDFSELQVGSGKTLFDVALLCLQLQPPNNINNTTNNYGYWLPSGLSYPALVKILRENIRNWTELTYKWL